MQDEFAGFLQQVNLLFKLVNPYTLQKAFIASFSIPTSPIKTNRSYFENCKSRFLFSNLRCSPIKTLNGLYERILSYSCFLKFNSIEKL